MCLYVFKKIPKYVEKTTGFNAHISELLNYVIIHSDSCPSLKNVDDLAQLIYKVFKKVSDADDSFYDNSSFYCSMISQLLLMTKKDLSDVIIKSFLSQTITKIDSILEDFLISQKNKRGSNLDKLSDSLDDKTILDMLGYITLIFCAFINYSPIAYEELIQRNYFYNLFEATKSILKSKNIPSYQLKLMSLGLSSWLMLHGRNEIIFSVLNLNFLVIKKQILVINNKTESNVITNNLLGIKDQKNNDSDSEDSEFHNKRRIVNDLKFEQGNTKKSKDDGIQEDESTLKLDEINEYCARLSCNLKHEDEYLIFKNVFMTIIKKFQNDVYQWVDSKTSEDKEMLKNLLRMKLVVLNNKKIAVRKAYKLKKQ